METNFKKLVGNFLSNKLGIVSKREHLAQEIELSAVRKLLDDAANTQMTIPSGLALEQTKRDTTAQTNIRKTPLQLQNLYFTNQFIFRGINVRANETISKGYKLLGGNEIGRTKCSELLERSGGTRFIRQLSINADVFGDAWIELVWNKGNERIKRELTYLDHIHPATFGYKTLDNTIDIIDVDDNGKPVGFQQISVDKEGNETEIIIKGKDKEKIAHLTFNKIADEFVGVSILQPLYDTAVRLMNMELSAAHAAIKTANPLIVVKTDAKSTNDLAKWSTILGRISGKEQIIVPNLVDSIEFLSPGNQNFNDYAEYFLDSVIAALGVPKHLLLGKGEDTNKACYTSDTEVLTENGWKKHNEWKKGEKITLFNPETGETFLKEPNKLHSYDIDEEIVRFVSGRQDLAVTSEHKIYYRPCPKTKFRIGKAAELEKRNRVEFKCGADNWKGEHLDIEDDYLRFIGWSISEGGLSSSHFKKKSYMMTLAQSNKTPEKVNEIRRVLKSIKASYSEYSSEKDDCTRWNVYGKELLLPLYNNIGRYSHEKKVPRDLLNLEKRQLNLLFEGLMSGDGSWDNRKGRTSGYYSTTSKQLADDVQEIAFKLGLGTKLTVHYEPYGNRKRCYRVSVREKNVRIVNNIFREQYKGAVYCFETETGLYVVRRNGCVSICGNTAIVESRHFLSLIQTNQGSIERVINEIFLKYADETGFDAPEIIFNPNLEDVYAFTDRAVELYKEGIISLEEARKIAGFEEDSEEIQSNEVRKNKPSIDDEIKKSDMKTFHNPDTGSQKGNKKEMKGNPNSTFKGDKK